MQSLKLLHRQLLLLPVALGKVKVVSPVEEGPTSVTLLVPLSESSKNSINPAPVPMFLTIFLHQIQAPPTVKLSVPNDVTLV